MSERAAPSDAPAPDTPNEQVYRTKRFLRGISGLGVVAVVFLVVSNVVDANRLWSVTGLLDLGMLLGVVGTGGGYLGRSIRITDEAVRKTWLLWPDQTVRFAAIRRVEIPMVRVDSAVKIYTDPDAKPSLTVEAQTFRNFDDLLRQIAHRLPEEAEVRDPAGRLQDDAHADAEGA